MQTARETKDALIAKFVRVWNANSYDEIKPVDPDRFVSYGHFLIYIREQIQNGSHDRHSYIVLEREPRSLIFPTARGYNYVLCGQEVGASEIYYQMLTKAARTSERWVIDLTGCGYWDLIVYWILPFVEKKEFDVKFSTVDAHIGANEISWIAEDGGRQRTHQLAPWLELDIPCATIAFVASADSATVLLALVDRCIGEASIHIASEYVGAPTSHIYNLDIGDNVISVPMDKWIEIIQQNPIITEGELPRDLWPY